MTERNIGYNPQSNTNVPAELPTTREVLSQDMVEIVPDLTQIDATLSAMSDEQFDELAYKMTEKEIPATNIPTNY